MAKFCTNCGEKLNEKDVFCSKCGASVETGVVPETTAPTTQQPVNPNINAKSKIAGGLFGIFLGSLGIHNFYLGYNSKGIAQLLLTLVGWVACGLGPMIAYVWGLIEGIMILAGSIDRDADGVPLKD